MAKPEELWEKERVYDSEISPLMTKIIEICKREKIPMVATFAYANDDEKVHMCTTILPFERRKVEELVAAGQMITQGFTAFMVTRRG